MLAGIWKTGETALDYSAKIFPEAPRESLCASPFAISSYGVPAALGGERAVRDLRQRCHALGMRLMLDFVPNHVSCDHAWATEQPHLLVTCAAEQQETGGGHTAPEGALVNGVYIAHGAEGATPSGAWGDTFQLDYSNSATHTAMQLELLSIVKRGLADGVRCDMAHLVRKQRFESAWGNVQRACPPAGAAAAGADAGPIHAGGGEFWEGAIEAVRSQHPDFIFLAECYGGSEAWYLQEMGFDFTYDDSFYHRARGAEAIGLATKHAAVPTSAQGLSPGQLVWPKEARQGLQPQASPLALKEHMSGSSSFHSRCCRYIENHDEPRAACVFALPAPAISAHASSTAGMDDGAWHDAVHSSVQREQARHFASLVLLLFSPGACLLHDGQLSGRRAHHSMHIAARPSEGLPPCVIPSQGGSGGETAVAWPSPHIASFYRRMLRLASRAAVRNGLWCPLFTCSQVAPADACGLIAFARVPVVSAEAEGGGAEGICTVVVVNMRDTEAGGTVHFRHASGGETPSSSEEGGVLEALRSLRGAPSGVAAFEDVWSGAIYRRSIQPLLKDDGGLHVHLPAWGFHVFEVTAAAMKQGVALTCAAVGDSGGNWKGKLQQVSGKQPVSTLWRL